MKSSFDYNFKLVVIEELLDKNPSFAETIEYQRQLWDEFYENDFLYDEEQTEKYFQKARELFEGISFIEEDLLKVEKLIFDGGLEIYGLLFPGWDGEDDTFDIHSMKGIEQLPNLKSVVYISMMDQDLVEKIKEMGIEVQ